MQDADSGSSTLYSSSLPTMQRGMRGHVIVFPSKPESLSPYLPPPIDEVITPICVVFVGSSPPSQEWLSMHAKPLIVRREKVHAALVWLKRNNPLYSDIIINHESLQGLPSHGVAPVNISTQAPSVAESAQGSRYDGIYPNSSVSDSNIFENVVVTDVDMHDISSNQMAAAAMQHLKKGKPYLQIMHGSEPVNEYDDENLFPLLYPTLFPYGKGGFLKSRTSPISFEKQARH
ncbi:hypothetical protein BS47DRAFT_1292747, partial [Hydnum rufescens UP504]